MNTPAKKLLLVDGSNLAFRMYFALERTGLTSPAGKPSWAIFGFLKALLDVIETENPTSTIAAFDTSGGTFRHEAFEYYKANRPSEMPPALAEQWPEIIRGLTLIGMSIVQFPGFEADDLIGTLALQAHNSGWHTTILSGDKDNFQLVNERIEILMPSVKGMIRLGRSEVYAKLGVWPEQVVDYKALCGDPSDNIPGVAGIGEKTASKLLDKFGDLENIYRNLEAVGSTTLAKKLFAGRESAKDSKFLATIKTDCPIAYDFGSLAHPLNTDFTGLIEFLESYKLDSLKRRLNKIFPSIANGSLHQESSTEPIIATSSSKLKIQRRIILDIGEWKAHLKAIKNSESLALDLETTGLDTFSCGIVGWALAYKDGEDLVSVYIPTGHTAPGEPEQLANELISQDLTLMLNGYTGRLFVQNIKFEYKILVRYGLKLPASTLDTMLASYLEQPSGNHSLKAQVLRVFGYRMQYIAELIGVKGSKQLCMNQLPIQKVGDYACDDAAFTLALGEHYLKILPQSLCSLWCKLESPLAIVLAEMELTGVNLDATILTDLAHQLDEEMQSLEEEIITALGVGAFNLNSSQQLASALENAGFKLSKATGTGQISTDARVLLKLKDEDETGLIAKIIDFRGAAKLRSTYTESLVSQIKQDTGRLHGEFNQALTTTGRLSSSNPNLQNIPIKNNRYGKVIRSAFCAPAGRKLITADYSQIELRILAHMSQDPTLIQAFTDNEDIHRRTAAEVFNVRVDDVTAEMRRLGKTLNFALIYQQGAWATARQLGISQNEASTFIARYFERFTGVRPFMNDTLNFARKHGYVETIWGRRRYFENLQSQAEQLRRADERAACNAPLQGSAADLMKFAMLNINNAISTHDLDCVVVLQVHDELVLEVKDEVVAEVAGLLSTLMQPPEPLKVPIAVDIASGSNWGACK